MPALIARTSAFIALVWSAIRQLEQTRQATSAADSPIDELLVIEEQLGSNPGGARFSVA
jgi:hypothetical protein